MNGSLGVYISLFTALYFEVFLLIAFLENRPRGRSSSLPQHYPSVCIVVPGFNEEKTIAGTIESLLALEYPKDKLSIMVVDDGSTDSTGEIAQQFVKTHPDSVQYFYKENGGKYTALNFAIAHTSAEFVGCLDADSFVVPNSLIEIIKKFESDPTICAVTPIMKVFHPHNILELMQSVEYTFGIFYKKMFDNISAISVLPGPFSIYRRNMFDKIGLFRKAHNTEDMEIAFRMHAQKLKIANAHTAHVYTTVPKNLRALIKQRTRWCQGFLQNLIDYRYMFLNPRFGNFGILVLPFGLATFVLGLYTAGYALYRVTTLVANRVSDLWLTGVPLQVPASHLSWFFLNTNTLSFLAIATFCMTILVIVLGQRIAEHKLPLTSIAYYFVFFGLIAPLWLARAAWGTLRVRESVWK